MLHGRHPHRKQVGGGAHGLNRNTGRVREHGVREVQRRGPLVHLGDESGHRTGVPSGEGFGDVVAGRNEQSLEGLELAQLFTHHNRDNRLLVGHISLVGRHILVGDDQGRARGAPDEGFVDEHDHRRHHLRDARRGCGRRVARAGYQAKSRSAHRRGADTGPRQAGRRAWNRGLDRARGCRRHVGDRPQVVDRAGHHQQRRQREPESPEPPRPRRRQNDPPPPRVSGRCRPRSPHGSAGGRRCRADFYRQPEASQFRLSCTRVGRRIVAR